VRLLIGLGQINHLYFDIHALIQRCSRAPQDFRVIKFRLMIATSLYIIGLSILSPYSAKRLI
jgi:hypothetical protein